MKTFSRLVAPILAVLVLAACYPWMKRIEVQQGNVIEQKQLDKLKPGISREQVRFLLGNPLVGDHFSDRQWLYYFYLRDRTDNRNAYRLTVNFAGDTYVNHSLEGEYFDVEQKKTN